MYRFIFLSLLIIPIVSCSSKYSKKNHTSTYVISDGIYLEVYKTYSGGVFSGDSYSYFLTDSVNFRKHVAITYHDDERVKSNFENGDVLLTKVKFQGRFLDTLEMKRINITNQIENGGWE